MQVLKMTKGSSRWGATCAYCNGRVRLNRTFVVDPENSAHVLHDGCYKLKAKRSTSPPPRVRR
jgi:hypothetical protein